MANDPETPSPDVMEVWREARAAYYSGPVTVHEASGSLLHIGSSGAAANIIAEAKARWEREAFEKAAQVAERLAFPKASSVWKTACRDVADQIRALKEPRP